MIITSIITHTKIRWKEKDFFPKKSTGVGMKLCERELCFIKHNISRNVHATSCNIKAFNTFVLSTVPKEDALCGTKDELTSVTGAKVRPTCTTEHMKSSVI